MNQDKLSIFYWILVQGPLSVSDFTVDVNHTKKELKLEENLKNMISELREKENYDFHKFFEILFERTKLDLKKVNIEIISHGEQIKTQQHKYYSAAKFNLAYGNVIFYFN